MRAVAYVRVSTSKEEQLPSLENQTEYFEKYVVSRGDELIKIYSDRGKSATKMKNRKELNNMLKAARAHKFEKLYVKDISRLFRNTLDFIIVSRELQDLGIQLHLVNMGEGKDIDTFTLNLMAMVAEQESQKISERVKFSKKMSKERGIVPNFVFGYDRIDKYTLVPNETESYWVKRVFDLYTEEGWGMARISKLLYENKVQTKKKKDGQPNYNWSQHTVGMLLRNRLYTGLVINGKEATKNIYTTERLQIPEEKWYITERPEFRIISDEQFEKAQKLMVENAKLFPTATKKGDETGMRRSDKHLFSNLIKCDSCGFSYRRTQKRYSENRPMKVWWTCSKRSAYGTERCNAEYIRIEEDWLKDGLNNLFNYLIQDKENFFQTIESKCQKLIQQYIQETSGFDIDELKDSIDDLNEQRDRLKTLAVKGLITMEEAEHDMIPINKELEKLNFSLHQTDRTREVTNMVKNNLEEFLQRFNDFNFSENIENADLKKIIKEIRVKSKEEIYVYFNVDDDLYDLQFPINLSGIFLPPEPPKGKGKNRTKTIEEAPNNNENVGSEQTYTNAINNTHCLEYQCRFIWMIEYTH